MTSYVINYSGGTIDIPMGQADTSNTSLTLIGRNWTSSNPAAGYGQTLNQNFVSLLENFAAPTQPANPLAGQFWYDTSTTIVKVNTGTPVSPVWADMYSSSGGLDRIANGTSSVSIPTVNGNINFTVGATSDVIVFTDSGANINGNLTVTGNSTLGANANVKITGGTTGQALVTDGAGNLSWTTVGSTSSLANGTTGISIPVADGDILFTVGGIANAFVITPAGASFGNIDATDITVLNVSTGANTTPGVFTGQWTLSTGSTLNATYADLAEYYTIDRAAGPATVVEFGGNTEVTVCQTDMSRRVAGVVSTNPAFTMNADGGKVGEIREAVALQGRVPCRVIGRVAKGDLMVSAGNGCARSEDDPVLGSVIGKALEAKVTEAEGIIEIVVGRT